MTAESPRQTRRARIPTRLAIGADVAKTNRIIADEVVQAQIDADNAYPEAVAVACANARQLVADLLADVIELTRDSATEPVAVEDE